ncbi:MAG: monovalent cation/H(+) antiporter subunit G [Azospirillaceae bacterium]
MSTVFALAAGLCAVTGSFFFAIAALGVLRLPDTLTRMHAATKAGTLGAGLLLAATAFTFASLEITIRVMAIIGFLLLTAPIAAHLIGRVAWRLIDEKNTN